MLINTSNSTPPKNQPRGKKIFYFVVLEVYFTKPFEPIHMQDLGLTVSRGQMAFLTRQGARGARLPRCHFWSMMLHRMLLF